MATNTGILKSTLTDSLRSLSGIPREILSYIKPIDGLISQVKFIEDVSCNTEKFLTAPVDGPDHVFIRPQYDFLNRCIVLREQQIGASLIQKKCVVLYDANKCCLFKSKIQYMVYKKLSEKHSWKEDVLLVPEGRIKEYMRHERVGILTDFNKKLERLVQFLSSDDLKSSLRDAVQECTSEENILESACRQNLKYGDRVLMGPKSRKRSWSNTDHSTISFNFNCPSPRKEKQQSFYKTDNDLKEIKKLLFKAINNDIARQVGKKLAKIIHDSIRPQAETEFKKIKLKPTDETFRHRVDCMIGMQSVSFLMKEVMTILIETIAFRFTITKTQVDVCSKEWREKVAREMHRQFSIERSREKFSWKFRKLIEEHNQELIKLLSLIEQELKCCKIEMEPQFSKISVYTYHHFCTEKTLSEAGEKIRLIINSTHPGVCQMAIPAYQIKGGNEECILVMLSDENKRQGKISIENYMSENLIPKLRIRAFNFCTSVEGSIKDASVIPNRTTPANIKQMQKVIEMYSPALLCNHSNIEVIRIGYKTVDGTSLRAIVIDCQHKGFIPFGEREFPSSLDGFPVCVQEAYLSDALGSLRLAYKGEKISNEPECVKYGSVGPFVSKGIGSFLTCGHVLCENDYLLQHLMIRNGGMLQEIPGSSRKVYHQVSNGENLRFARTKAVWYGDVQWREKTCGVDMAVAEVIAYPSVTNGKKSGKTGLKDWPHYNLAKPFSNTPNCKATELVYKCGGTTGLTVGKMQVEEDSDTILFATCTSKHFPQNNGSYNAGYAFRNQYEIASAQKGLFADAGDSGSTVFVVRNKRKAIRPVGMITKTKSGSKGSGCRTTDCVAYATPIEAIEIALKNIDPEYRFLCLQNYTILQTNNIENGQKVTVQRIKTDSSK